MTSQIAVFPLPFLTFALAALAGALCLRHDFGSPPARVYFAAFFAVVALGSLLAGLRFGYGMDGLILLQRALPLFWGPLVFLGFASLSAPPAEAQKLKWINLGPALAGALLTLSLGEKTPIVEWLIGVSYAIYAVLLGRMWWRGPDGMIHVPLESATRIANWAGVTSVFLLIALCFDTAIAVFFALDRSRSAFLLISAAAVMMAALIAAGVSYAIFRSPASNPARKGPAVSSGRDHSDILSRADELMNREAIYLDTAITAERLAKRLHVPVRALSEAINQRLGVSISQYVNSYRVRRAASLLAEGDLDITQIIAQSGFLSRSNFYREFQRAYGLTPVAFRKKEHAAPTTQVR